MKKNNTKTSKSKKKILNFETIALSKNNYNEKNDIPHVKVEFNKKAKVLHLKGEKNDFRNRTHSFEPNPNINPQQVIVDLNPKDSYYATSKPNQDEFVSKKFDLKLEYYNGNEKQIELANPLEIEVTKESYGFGTNDFSSEIEKTSIQNIGNTHTWETINKSLLRENIIDKGEETISINTNELMDDENPKDLNEEPVYQEDNKMDSLQNVFIGNENLSFKELVEDDGKYNINNNFHSNNNKPSLEEIKTVNLRNINYQSKDQFSSDKIQKSETSLGKKLDENLNNFIAELDESYLDDYLKSEIGKQSKNHLERKIAKNLK